jgi:hypothetical protein
LGGKTLAELIAMLDTNVLYPPTLRSLLLETAAVGLYQPRWSQDIVDELFRHLDARIGAERARSIVDAMNRRFAVAAVADYAPLIASLTISPKDRHVLAAAIAGRASVIVTRNLRDFPPTELEPYEVDVRTPDVLVCQFLGDDPSTTVRAVQAMAESFGETLSVILDRLKPHVPVFEERLRVLRTLEIV